MHETRLFDLKSAQNARVVTILHQKPEPEEEEKKEEEEKEHGKLQPDGPAVRRHSSHALAASPRPLARTTRTRIEIDFPVLGEAYRIFSPPKPPIFKRRKSRIIRKGCLLNMNMPNLINLHFADDVL